MSQGQLKKYISTLLKQNTALVKEDMKQLSLLGGDGLEFLRQSWQGTERGRRRKIVSALLELSRQQMYLDFSPIFAFCLEDEDARVRAAAVSGIADEEDESLIPAFSRLLAGDSSAEVRLAAAAALGKLALQGELGRISEASKQQVYASLLQALDKKKESQRIRAAELEAIAPLNMPRVRGLIEAAYHSSQPLLKISAINAMGYNCNRLWLTALAQEAQSDNVDMRLAAIRALGELGEEDAALYLLEALDDEHPRIQEEAIHALGQIGGEEARNILNRLLDDAEERISNAARTALQELKF
jgi:HEAT repeat protein